MQDQNLIKWAMELNLVISLAKNYDTTYQTANMTMTKFADTTVLMSIVEMIWHNIHYSYQIKTSQMKKIS